MPSHAVTSAQASCILSESVYNHDSHVLVPVLISDGEKLQRSGGEGVMTVVTSWREMMW